MDDLLLALQRDGFSVPDLKLNNSKIVRFDRTGNNKSGWFIGYELKTKTQESYIVAIYGDWRTGERYEFKTKREYTKEQDREILRKLQLAQTESELERQKLQEIAKRQAHSEWESGSDNPGAEYLRKKQITKLYGCRTSSGTNGRSLLVPVCDSHGQLWGIQTINPGGQKYFSLGGRIKGCFHIIGSDLNSLTDTIYIAEGFATAVSIHEAIEKPIVMAFNANNIPNVAEALKEKFPTAKFIICADNDIFTERGGIAYNPGKDFAERAAKICGGSVVLPQFLDLSEKPTDFDDLKRLEGLVAVREQISGIAELPAQYILCLGFHDDLYFYSSSQNKYIRSLPAANHTKMQLLNLMDLTYWQSQYPAKNEDAINWTEAANDLMLRCRQRGPFNLNNVRATGSWLGDNKELILNRGDTLVTSTGTKIGFHSIKSRFVYEPGDHLLPMPSKDYLSNQECMEFLSTLNMLHWAHKDYFKFLSGWLMIAPICGALQWRPHLWLSGASGSGKSTIMTDVVHKILKNSALFFQGQTTEAGIRQAIAKKAMPVVFDEFETQDERSGWRISGVVELCRQASSETNAQIVKGSASGEAIAYLSRFQALVSSVNVNLTFEADKNRFTVIELLRPSHDPMESSAHFGRFQKKLDLITDEWVHRFYSRPFVLWDVFIHNRSLLFKAITERYNARFGQQYGALLAGYSLFMSDAKMSESDAIGLVNSTDLEMRSKEHEESDEMECLSYLLSKKVHVNGEISQDATVFDMISNSKGNYQTHEWIKALRHHGMIIKDEHLYVANNHGETASLFKGTKWGNSYNRSLLRVSGASNNGNKPIWVSGSAKKCVKIPLDQIKLVPT